jgi:Pretoxin HINT domain
MVRLVQTVLTCLALVFAASAAGARTPALERVQAAEVTAISINQLPLQNSALFRRGYSIVRYQNISECVTTEAAMHLAFGCGAFDLASATKDCAKDCLMAMLPIPDPCGRFGKLFSVAVGLYGATNEPNSFEGHTLVHTRVLTDTGYQTRLKPIADIQIGDEVLAWDELQAHDNAAVLKQAGLEEKEAVFRRGYSIVSYENNSNSDAKAATSVSAKAVTSAPSAQRYEKVTDTFSSVKQQTLLHITLSNGQTLQATQGHPFKTSEGWRDAILLKKGGKLLLKGGDADDAANNASPAERYTTITNIRTEVKTLPVFNLEVANLHTFFVGEDGVVVHNGVGGPKPKGQGPHNQMINDIAQEIVDAGGVIVAGGQREAEKLISCKGGKKGGRRPDIIAKDANGKTFGVNVGKTDRHGRAIPREQQALDDLNGFSPIPTTFRGYN